MRDQGHGFEDWELRAEPHMSLLGSSVCMGILYMCERGNSLAPVVSTGSLC